MSRYLTNLAGLSFRPKEAKDVVRALTVGEKLRLEREPDNAYDSNAIRISAIVDKGEGEDDFEVVFIGFVERLVNGPIAADLDDGMTYSAEVLVVYDIAYDGDPKAWMRPLIQIYTEVKDLVA